MPSASVRGNAREGLTLLMGEYPLVGSPDDWNTWGLSASPVGFDRNARRAIGSFRLCVWHRGIKLGKVLKRLRGKLNVIGQARFCLVFTSSNGIRSVEPSDDWSRARISPVSSSPLSGSAMMSCNSSCTTFLISACNLSTVKIGDFHAVTSYVRNRPGTPFDYIGGCRIRVPK